MWITEGFGGQRGHFRAWNVPSMYGIGKGMWQGMWAYKSTFFCCSICRARRRAWRGSKRPGTVWGPLLQTSPLLLFYHLQLCQGPGVEVRDGFPFEVYDTLSIRRICIALSRCSQGTEALERIYQCHVLVQVGEQVMSNMREGWRQPLGTPKPQVCLGRHHISLWVLSESQFLWEGQPVYTKPPGWGWKHRKMAFVVGSYWRGGTN